MTCLAFFRLGRGQTLPVRELLFGFWVVTVTPDFVSCYDTEMEVVVNVMLFVSYIFLII
jgi:hypothetical protein